MRRSLSTFIALVFLLAAAGCMPILSLDSEVSLKGSQKWDSTVKLKVAAQTAQMIGASSDSFNQINQQLRNSGVEAEMGRPSTDRDGNVTYTLTMHGEGYDRLNQAFTTVYNSPAFEPVPDKPGQVHFSFNPGAIGALSSSFTLRCGRIISTNGRKVNPWTITWENTTSPMEAVVVEGSGSLGLLLALGAAALLIIAIVLVVMATRRRTAPAYNPYRTGGGNVRPVPPRPSPAGRACRKCRSALPPGAVFCPRCGTKN